MKVSKSFFNPKSIAVIGASHEPKKLGYIVFSNFVKGKFKGKAYAVNPNTKSILGKKSYKSVLDIPGRVDLAIVMVPAKIVSLVLKECVKKKVESVIIISAGFAETGNQGKRMENELKRIISGTKTKVIGPNCLGVYDTSSQVDTLFLSRERCGRPKQGNISFISQSGAVGSTILDWMANEKIGMSKFISYGNAMNIDESDLIEFLGEDKSTKVILAYLEGIESSGEKFIKIAKKVSKKKPIIVLKAGKTKKGMQAVSSHTGSLAGSGQVYSGAFKQANVIEADNWEELLDFALAFSTQPIPKGNRIAVVTDGGGFGVLATDEAEKRGLLLLEPSEKLKQKMRKLMPSYVSLHNPIDLTGDADAKRYKLAIEECMKSKEFDGVIAITLFQVPTLGKEIVDYLVAIKRKYKKPLLACAAGGKFSNELSDKLIEKRIPVYSTPERAVRAMKAMLVYLTKI